MKNIIKMIETRIEKLNDQAGLFINRGQEEGMRLAVEELEKVKKEILLTLLREAKEQK